MYAGAALSAVTLIVTALSFHAIEKVIRNATSTLTQQQVHQAAVLAVTIAVVESLIAIGLWLLMAWANKNGRNWGRITATVLFGLNTLFLLLSFVRASVSISLAFSLLVWLVGLGAIVLLWRKESSQYFAAASSRP
jgi:ABC-type spermidine/putrescine transport system permease subunit II